MREYIVDFFEKFDYPEEAREVLLNAYDVLTEKEEDKAILQGLFNEYKENMNCSMLAHFKAVEAMSARLNVHINLSTLLLFICHSKQLKEYYKQNGISEDIWFNTMCDLKYKLIECKLVKGMWGSFVPVWFFDFYSLKRFALGRLQFELYKFKRNYTEGDVILTPESPCLNVHIPRTGGRLDHEDVIKAYEMASKFFAKDFVGQPIVFICHSWLLYPRVNALLSPKSNIFAFANDFKVIETGDDKDYSEVWRLFDVDYDGNPDNLPQDTSLRRAVTELIRNNEKYGWGFGVYIYKK